jgi:hypothetical protein
MEVLVEHLGAVQFEIKAREDKIVSSPNRRLSPAPLCPSVSVGVRLCLADYVGRAMRQNFLLR